jgi:hypothetical protein
MSKIPLLVTVLLHQTYGKSEIFSNQVIGWNHSELEPNYIKLEVLFPSGMKGYSWCENTDKNIAILLKKEAKQ